MTLRELNFNLNNSFNSLYNYILDCSIMNLFIGVVVCSILFFMYIYEKDKDEEYEF